MPGRGQAVHMLTDGTRGTRTVKHSGFFFPMEELKPVHPEGWGGCHLITWWSVVSLWSQPSPEPPRILSIVSLSVDSILMLLTNLSFLGHSPEHCLSQQNPFVWPRPQAFSKRCTLQRSLNAAMPKALLWQLPWGKRSHSASHSRRPNQHWPGRAEPEFPSYLIWAVSLSDTVFAGTPKCVSSGN